ncbi:hypothetical protein [Cognatishimia sp.]|uniref:hypothetical protein n=1 Tax=Cognatishimia sp. TaxID=2211648 RepID=UPI0035119AAE|nr:endodeoxyribonuclease RusA [Cognatishimia sp.]
MRQKPIELTLPWPPRALNGHAKGHWRPKATATAKYRAVAHQWANVKRVPKIPDAVLEFKFYPPDRRHRDIQNMPGMMKAGIDGIADAMGCDDNGFRPRFPDHFEEPVKGGKVVIVISKLLEGAS